MAAQQPQEPGINDDERSGGEQSGPPTGAAVFAADTTIRPLLDPGHSMHWSEFGGHFPATEVPNLLVGDLRAFFRPLRTKEGA